MTHRQDMRTSLKTTSQVNSTNDTSLTQKQSFLGESIGKNPKDLFFLGAVMLLIGVAPWFRGLMSTDSKLLAPILILVLFTTRILFIANTHALFPVRNSIDKCVLVFLCLAAFYSVVSIVPFASISSFIRVLSLVAVYFMAKSVLTQRKDYEVFRIVTIGIGVFYAVIGLLQYYGFLEKTDWFAVDHLSSRFTNSGHFASFLLIPLFFCLSNILSNKLSRFKILFGITFCIMLWAFTFTWSRTNWISFIGAIGAYLFLLGYLGLFSNKRIFLLGLGLLLVGTGFLYAIDGWEKIVDRFVQLWDDTDTKFYSINHRFQLWVGSWHAIIARPWGWGLDSFVYVFPQFRIHSDRFLLAYAHNEYVQAFVEYGVLGLGLMILFMGSVVGTLKGLMKTNGDSYWRNWTAVSLSIVFCFMVVSLFEFSIRIYAISILLVVFIAAISQSDVIVQVEMGNRFEVNEQVENYRGRNWIIGGLSILCVIVAIFNVQTLRAENKFVQGVDYQTNIQVSKAIDAYQESIEIAPWDDKYHRSLGLLRFNLAEISSNKQKAGALYEQAILSLNKASEINPRVAKVYTTLALSQEALGEIDEARNSFIAGLRYVPKNVYLHSEYGKFALRQGLGEEALAAFKVLKGFDMRDEVLPHHCEWITQLYGILEEAEEIRDTFKGDWREYTCLSMLLANDGKYDEAFKILENSVITKFRRDHEMPYRIRIRDPLLRVFYNNNQYQFVELIIESDLSMDDRDKVALSYRTKLLSMK